MRHGWRQKLAVLQAIAALSSSAAFMHYLEAVEPDFSGWGDVFYFCGSSFQFCTCSLIWNLLGWYKAIIIWLFVVSSAAGVRHLLMSVTLGGLLPGEEHIDREALISIVWRLVPYWMNHWCGAVMPHLLAWRMES
jgi:hypothetical protein